MRSEADRGALLSEARILFGLPPSPHLPIVREDFFDGDDYVIVMDWVAGSNLDRILHAEGRPGLPPTLVLGWLADAAAALTHLHNQDPPVFHGDISRPTHLTRGGGGRGRLRPSSKVSGRRRGGTPACAPERSSRGEQPGCRHLLARGHRVALSGGPPPGIRRRGPASTALVDQIESAIRGSGTTRPPPGHPGG